MRAGVISLLLSWLSGVSLSLIFVISLAGFTEGHLPLKKLWVMGIIHIAGGLGTAISILLSPLVVWAFKGLDKLAVLHGGMLFGSLAFYFIGISFIGVWLKYEDVYGIFAFVVPAILAISGLVYIGQVQRGRINR